MQDTSLELIKIRENLPPASEWSALAQELSDVLLVGKENLSGPELTLLFDILCELIEDIELEVRAKLSERLAARDDVPLELILYLANDEILVANPILISSELLDDNDLMRLVRKKTRDHRLAITERHWLSPDVSEELVQTGDPTVVVSLLRNDNAELYPKTAERLVRQCRDKTEYREPLVRREDLSPELAAKLYVWLGDVLRNHIVERFQLDPSVIEDAISSVLAEAMSEFTRNPNEELRDNDKFNGVKDSHAAKTLLDYLKSGSINRFEQHFATLTALPLGVVKRALYDTGVEGLAIACKGGGFDQNLFAELLWRFHGSGAFLLFRTSRKFKKAMENFALVDPGAAMRMLRSWQTAPPESD